MALRVDDIDLIADRALVERWQAGEHEAFDDLYRRYFDRLTSYCQRRVGDRHAAEEIAQESFVKALQALPRFAGERRFYPWVTVIASRLCVDHHRRNARIQPSDTIDPGSVDGDHGVRLAFLADVDSLDRALQRLGPRHLEVLELREREGMSYRQIADHLAVPQSTVEALLFRARKALKREFMAVTGERLVAIPLVGGLLARVAARVHAVKDRLAEAMPSLAQLGGPVAAGAMAVALTVGPLAPSPGDGGGTESVRAGDRAAVATAPVLRPWSPTEVPVAPDPSLGDSGGRSSGRGSGSGTSVVPTAPTQLSQQFGVQTVPADEGARSAEAMPITVEAGPVLLGASPETIVEEWLPTLLGSDPEDR